MNPETIFVTPDGDAGPEHELIPSLSIANLLQQREAVMTLFQEALAKLEQAHALANAARIGFPDISLSRDWRGHGIRVTGEDANRTTLLETFQASVDAGGWMTLLNDSGLRSLMCASKRKAVDEQIHGGKVPELTREAIVSTFSTLHESREEMFDQGVIECFKRLSWDYTTNQPQKFEKRIVMTYLTSYGSANHTATDHLDDLLRVFHLCDGKPEADYRHASYSLISTAMQASSVWPKLAENDYFSIRLFKNQNGHVTFKRPDLVTRLNRIVAKHYPHALPAPKG
ncbi:MAG: hypothetical protein A4E19_18740 [Nitrospira sp. SG-bin1]|nr:MAG: hypothetical protein A4E19_18740 [Nitrospira sp. SG-bin1]